MQAGFSRRIKPKWIELAAHLALNGVSEDKARAQLHDELSDQLAVGSKAPGNARHKTVNILMRIWVSPPHQLVPLRDDALQHLGRLPVSQHGVLHWGMAAAVYPFFGLVADVVGRLLRLQGKAGAIQVQRRVGEQLGDRNTIVRSTRYVLRTFVDWHALRDTSDKGVYEPAPPQPIANSAAKAWLVEAILRASGSNVGALKSLSDTAALFPFATHAVSVTDIGANNRLEWFRQGVSEDMIALRKVR